MVPPHPLWIANLSVFSVRSVVKKISVNDIHTIEGLRDPFPYAQGKVGVSES